MPGLPSLKRNFVFSAANLGLNILFPLVSFAYVARILGPEALGQVNFAFAVAALFLLLAAVALPIYGPKAIAQARDDRSRLDATFSELFILNFMASAFWSLCFLVIVFSAPALRSQWPLFLIAGSSLVWNSAHVDWLFAGLEDFRSLFIRGFLIKLASLILLFVLVRSKNDTLAFAALNVLTGGAANLWGIAASRNLVRFRWKGIRILRHLRPMAAVSGSSVASGVYTQMDNVLLGMLAGHQAVGLYSAAMKIPRLASLFLVSLGSTAIPRLAYHAGAKEADDRQALKVREKSLSLLLLLALPAASLVIAMAPKLLLAITGPEFAAGTGAMRLGMLVAMPAVAANFVGMQILLPNGDERALMLGSLAGAVFNVGLNLALIPYWGILGSAFAAVATETLVLGSFIWLSRERMMPVGTVAVAGLRYLAASCVAAAAARWVGSCIATPWLGAGTGLLCGGLLYLSLLWAARDDVARDLMRYPFSLKG